MFAVSAVILIRWSNPGPKLLKILEEGVHRELDKIDGKFEKSNKLWARKLEVVSFRLGP